MSILQRVDDARRLWALLIPHTAPPSDSWLAKWASAFGDAEIESAFTRTSRKFHTREDAMSDTAVHRYCSATLRHRANEREGRHIFSTETAQKGTTVTHHDHN